MNSSVASWMETISRGIYSHMYPWQKVCIITEISSSRLLKKININRRFYS